MNIVLICAALQPGRDGVGDYARRLAGELIRTGHQAAIIALNDRYIQTKITELQIADKVEVPVMRLPAAWPMSGRLNAAEKWIDKLDPDWLSLQFVPFGFHPKGLKLMLGRQLYKIGGGRQWHIMFHELWVGMDEQSPAKHILWGWAQRQLIKAIIKQLKPVVIHTQAGLYQLQLAKLDVKAGLLRLFGNVPVLHNAVFEKDANTINFLIFGHIHFGAPAETFALEAVAYAKKRHQQVSLTFAGRCGSSRQDWELACLAAGLPVKLLGESSPERIAEELQKATIGITTTPAALADKSGTVAAMLEHGLPVLCVARVWEARMVKNSIAPQGILTYEQGKLEVLLNKLQAASAVNNKVSDIGAQLIDSLNGKF